MFRLNQIIFPILLVACAGKSIAQVQPVSTASLTQAQALGIATRFSASLGHPLSGRSPYQPNSAIAPKANISRSLPEWKFTQFDGKNSVDVEVVAATGVVSGYMNHTDTPDPQPEDAPMSKSEAIAQATVILTRAGALKTNELTFNRADLTPFGKDTTEWWVSWNRTYQGVVYREQGASIGFNGETGRLLGFGVNFKTPPPSTMKTVFSQEQAIEVADRQLQDAGYLPGSVIRVKTEIVMPNTFWKPGGSEANSELIARAAWVCVYKSSDEIGDVWVDRETGLVIGGTSYNSAKYAGPRKVEKPIATPVPKTVVKSTAKK